MDCHGSFLMNSYYTRLKCIPDNYTDSVQLSSIMNY